MSRIQDIDMEIEALSNRINVLSIEKEELERTIKQAEITAPAYQNALAAMFDGIKIIANPEKPFRLELPMYVYANQYYVLNDGFKDIRYICFKTGVVTEENFNDYLEPENPDDLLKPDSNMIEE